MSGITAVFGDYKNKEVFVKKSLEKIKHRGTKNFEIKIFNRAGIGINYLSITNKENLIQSFSNENETIFAILDGEIFNYKDLKKDLEEKGYKFRTNSNTELLIYLWEEYNIEIINYIDSEMYAFIIYDTEKNEFFAARDPLGIKPLYYAKHDENIFFASEMKQLVQFDFIKEIYEIPPGSYFFKDKIKKYIEFKVKERGIKNENYIKKELTKLLINAIKKRVDTDLPVAVLLSGGVDSSLIMEIANRFHKNVTAYILGKQGSPDYEAALRLCKKNNYKYKIVYPDIDYQTKFKEITYHLETYETQTIRNSFSLDVIYKTIKRDGYKIALSGDGADEIFAGYSQFAAMKPNLINFGCKLMLDNLNRSKNLKIDRISMKHSLEIRTPFLDRDLIEFALKINGNLKMEKHNDHITPKSILRKVAEEFLPDFVIKRYKISFSNSACMNIGFDFKNKEGEFAKTILKFYKNIEISEEDIDKYNLDSKEEFVYFNFYKKNKYVKLYDSFKRILTEDDLPNIDEQEETYLLVAEFGQLPLYFPIYFASKYGIYKRHNLNVNFVSTGRDDLTYNSLLDGSAQIGIADPIFSFAENKFHIKGKIIGELIGTVPFKAVTLNPEIKINSIKDFEKYKIGTYPKFSTCHTIMKKLLPNKELIALEHTEVLKALKERTIDIGIVVEEQAIDLKQKGGHILFSFSELFNELLIIGIFISDNLDPEYNDSVIRFKAALKESINFIKDNEEEAIKIFKELFPELLFPEEIFYSIVKYWNRRLKISMKGLEKLKNLWREVYPWLLKSGNPTFVEETLVDKIIQILSHKQVSRDIPYMEDEMAFLIKKYVDKKKPIKFIGLWGATSKRTIDERDIQTIDKIVKINDMIKKIYPPGAEIIFILTDRHAELNKFDKKDFKPYLEEVKEEFKKRGIKTMYLNKIWKEFGLDKNKILDRTRTLTSKEWDTLPIKRELETQAKKLGFENYLFEAKRYYLMRTMESKILQEKFKDYIFMAFNEDKFQIILPELPTLYLWTIRKGYAHVPWLDFSNEKSQVNF